MLRYLRENTENWIIKIFLGIIVVVFVFLGIGSMRSGNHDTVAVVDGEPISIQQFQTAYENMMEQAKRQFGENLNEDLLKVLNLKQQALDALINQKLVRIQAKKLGIIVSDQELSQSLLEISSFQKDGRFDMDLYQNLLKMHSMTPADFEELQRDSMREQKLTQMITDTVIVSDLEARQWYSYVNARMAVDYVLVEPETFPAPRPSDEIIEKNYRENEKSYQSQVHRKAEYLEFSPEDYLGHSKVTKAQVEEFYHKNQARFHVPEKVEARHILIKTEDSPNESADGNARDKALQVYKKAVAGEDFAALAQKFSQGPSRTNGGYLGSFARGEMVKPFEDAAFALEAGQISKPVKTSFGWHVIQVVARHEAVTRTLTQAAGEITQELELQEAKNLAYEAAGKAFDIVIDGDDMEQAALIAKKQIQRTPPFDQTGKDLQMPMAQAFAEKTFLLSFDTISDVIQLGDRYYIIRVTEEIAPELLPLDQVKDQIAARIQAQEQKDTAKKIAEQILEKVTSGTSLKEAGAEQGLAMASTTLFSRRERVSQLGAGQALTDAAFELTRSNPLCKKVLETPKGFVLMQFKTREEPSREEMDSRMEMIRTQLAGLQKRQYYQEWIGSLRDKASIEVEERFFK